MNHDIIHAALLLGTFGAVLTALAHVTVYVKFRRGRRAAQRSEFTPPISILKPLKGIDDNLYDNLLSFVRQDYPCFELLLGVDDADDPAIAVARQLQQDCPRAPIRLVVRRCRVGLNPKVNNLISLFDEARFDHLLISDSNVMVGRDYLRETVAPLADPKVGLVSNPIVGDGEHTLGSWLENFHLNTFIIAGVCFGDWLGRPLVIGKSMLMRRCNLTRLGGFHAVRDVLAEDYVLGVRFNESGLRVVLSPHTVCTVNQHWNVSRTLSRHGRWAKLRRALHPSAYLLEPVAYSGLWFFLALALSVARSDPHNTHLAVAGLVSKAALDVGLFAFVRRERPSLLVWPLSVLRDCLLLTIWARGCVSRTVQWRGNLLRIGRGTLLTPVTPWPTLGGIVTNAIRSRRAIVKPS